MTTNIDDMVRDIVLNEFEEKENEITDNVETITQDYLDNNLESIIESKVKEILKERDENVNAKHSES